MIALDQEKQGRKGNPEFTAFDSFAAKLLDTNQKWVPQPTLVTLPATAGPIVLFNPFRIFLAFYYPLGAGGTIFPSPLIPTALSGIAIAQSSDRYEYFLGKDGPITTMVWNGFSSNGGKVLIVEGIYRGDTTNRKYA